MSEEKINTESSFFWREYSKRQELDLNSLMNLETDKEKSKKKFEQEKKKMSPS